jgi:hypothetical protein
MWLILYYLVFMFCFQRLVYMLASYRFNILDPRLFNFDDKPNIQVRNLYGPLIYHAKKIVIFF